MDIRLKMREGFRDLQGGLFGKVEKADVGGAAEEVQRAGGDMLGWATRSSRRSSPASSRGRTASPSCRSATSSSPRDRIPACCLR